MFDAASILVDLKSRVTTDFVPPLASGPKAAKYLGPFALVVVLFLDPILMQTISQFRNFEANGMRRDEQTMDGSMFLAAGRSGMNDSNARGLSIQRRSPGSSDGFHQTAQW